MFSKSRLLLLGLFIAMPASGAGQQTIEPFHEIASDLQWIKHHQPLIYQSIAAQASSVLNDLNSARQRCLAARHLADTTDLTIDFIGMRHGYEGESAQNQLATIASQHRVAFLLDSLHYELIGFEAETADTVIYDPEVNEVSGEPDSMEAGLLTYLRSSPYTHVIGTEVDSIHELEVKTIFLREYYVQKGGLDPPSLIVLDHDLGQARSELALATIILTLPRYHLTRGAMIMGLLHESDFRRLAKRYRFHYQSFIAEPIVAGD